MNKSKSATSKAKQTPVAAQVTVSNHTLVFRRNHPQGRCSYGIAGVPGLVGFDLRMFADGKPPKSIVLDCALAVPVAKVPKVAKVAAAATA
jgi:hypothetical protein